MSSLKAQLDGLAHAKKQATDGKKIRGKPSLLFDYAKAGDLDLLTIHHIGCEGLDELCRLDPRFATYRGSLFSQASSAFSRDATTPDVVAKMDDMLDTFLAQLSPHFMTPGSFKALEYLIRRFRVNEYNIPSLILAALPYHGTNEFVRLVQTMSLDNAKGWAWLARMQGSGASLPRDVLVQRCANDRSVLRFVCDGAKRLGLKKAPSRTYLSFYAVALCEVVAVSTVDEALVEFLLPYLVEGLAVGAATDYRAATCMALAELCSRASLSTSFLGAVAVSLVRGMERSAAEHVRTVLLVLAHAASTQRQLTELPTAALKGLLSVPDLNDHLSALSTAGCRMGHLLALLADTLVSRLLSAKAPEAAESAAPPLLSMAAAGLLQHHAQALCSRLLAGAAAMGGSAALAPPEPEPAAPAKKGGKAAAATAAKAVVAAAASAAAAAASEGAAARSAAQAVLRALERRHPESVDAAIDAALTQHAAPAGSDSDDDSAGGAEQGGRRERGAVYDFVAETFASTAHALVPGGGGSTVIGCAASPQASMRVMALQQADELLASGTLPEESASTLHGLAVSALADPDWIVVSAALAMAALPASPVFALLPALQALLQRLGGALLGPKKLDDVDDAARVAKGALALAALLALREAAAEPAASSDGEAALPSVASDAADTALLAVLDFALAPPHALAAARAAIAAARTLASGAAGPSSSGKSHRGKAASAGGSATSLLSALAPALGAWDEPPASFKAKSKVKAERKAAKVAASLELRRCAVAGLVTALSGAAPDGPLATGLLRLTAGAAAEGGSGAHLHARHLLLLGAHAALAQQQAGGSKGGKGKGSSDAAAHDTARLLQRLCRSEISAMASSAPAFDGWQAWAGDALEASSGAPTAEHTSSLRADPLAAHALLAAHGLHAALSAAAASSSAPTGGDSLSSLASDFDDVAALVPASAFSGHLRLLLTSSRPAPTVQASFLRGVYGRAAAGAGGLPASQAAALCLHAELGPSCEPGAKRGSPAVVSAASDALPYLLAAAGSAHREVRSAAAATMRAFADAAGGPASSPATAVMASLASRSTLLEADALAAGTLLRRTLCSPAPPTVDATPSKKGKVGKKGEPASTAGRAGEERLSELDATACSSAASAFVGSLRALGGAACGAAELSAAAALLFALLPEPDGADDAAPAHATPLLDAAAELAASVLAAARGALPAQALPGPGAQAALTCASPLLAGALCQQPPLLRGGSPAAAVAVALLESSSSSSADALAPAALPLRAALLCAMASDPAIFPSLCSCGASTSGAVRVFAALVAAASGDSHEGCRRSARAVLEAAPVTADMVVPLLAAAIPRAGAPPAPAAVPQRKRSKKGGDDDAAMAEAADAAAVAAGPPDAGALMRAVMVLELLQWKGGLGGPGVIAAAAQQLLDALLPLVGSISVPANEDGADGDDADADEVPVADDGAGGLASLCGYAAQLVLSGVEALAATARDGHMASADAEATMAAMRPGLAVAAAQAAPDSSVRNAALSLLALLGGVMPEAVLGHVLQVLSVINVSAAVQDDAHSQAVASTAMAALVPAWTAHGKRDSAELWGVVVDALPSVAPHRRLHLLGALMTATGAHDGLPVALTLLLKAASDAPDEPSAADAAAEGVAQAAQDASAPAGVWLPELAAKLAAQVPPHARVPALASLLNRSLQAAGGFASERLPRLGVAFVEGQLRARGLPASRGPVAAAGQPGEAAAEQLQAGCGQLMSAALDQVQALASTPPAAVAAAPGSAAKKGGAAAAATAAVGGADKASKRAARATKAALEGLYGLLSALQGVMSSDAYLGALSGLAQHPSDKLRRRALKLFADKVRMLRGELESLSELPERLQAEHEERLASAALLPLRALPDQLASTPPPSPLLKQALLAAAGTSAAAFGRLRPEAVSGCVPALLTCARDASPAVRGSALVALAAAAGAVGVRLVPHLPAAMAALLESASGAAARLAAAPPSDAAAAGTAPPSVASGAKPAGKDGAAAPDAPPAGSEDEPAYELASALAALSSMLDALGALLSPYLRDVLHLLLSLPLLNTSTGGVAASAASVRTWLPSVIPARLLFEPLFAQLPGCIEAGPQSTKALLALVASATERLDTKAAATYSEQVFLFLLRVLDVRALHPLSLAGHVHDVEASALACLVALTMKLTESRFKPMFLRLLEWAAADGTAALLAGAAAADGASHGADADSGGGGGAPRQVVLFGAAAALTGRLRSVFVPYFRYLLDPAVSHLAGDAPGAHKKKKRRASTGGVGAAGGGEAEWLLRMRVVRALHRGMLHDGGGFFDAEKLERLLPPLVAQLEAVPPAAVLPALSLQCSDADLDGYIHAGRSGSSGVDSYDAPGVAAAAALVQMGVTANSDVFWKPLNYRVLMVTRSGNVRARLLALEVVFQLVERLREEYLPLLPETIPFVAELLEDTETAVEARAQQLVALLEEISGEKLDQYLKI